MKTWCRRVRYWRNFCPYEFDKHPQLSIHSHYCDCDMKFSFWDWCVICEVERATWVKPHKGPRRIWEIEHDLLSTDLGRNRVGEEEICLLSQVWRRCYIKYIFFSRSSWTLQIDHFTFTEPKVIKENICWRAYSIMKSAPPASKQIEIKKIWNILVVVE